MKLPMILSMRRKPGAHNARSQFHELRAFSTDNDKERCNIMKRFLVTAGALGALALVGAQQANAEVPSFGRLVFAASGGTVVLPRDAWLPTDTNFKGDGNPSHGVFGYNDTIGQWDYNSALASVGGSGNDGAGLVGQHAFGTGGLNTAGAFGSFTAG